MMKIDRNYSSGFLALMFSLCLSCQVPANQAESDREIKITTGAHDDEGPADRYSVPYQPINYNQAVEAPLPGLAYDYKLYDWDEDGLVDILANVRRGGGIVFYKNVGNQQEPMFRMLKENEMIMDRGRLGRYFDVMDVDGDGKVELLGYEGQNDISKLGEASLVLSVYFNQGSKEKPEWVQKYAAGIDGERLEAPKDVWNAPRLSVADWDNDGKQDLIIGVEHINETVPEGLPQQGSNRMSGFRDPEVYNTQTGELYFLKNATQNEQEAVFEQPVRLSADGKPIQTYIHPYPTVFDIDQDGLQDLLVGSHNTEVKVFINEGSKEQPKLTEKGLLSKPDGSPIRTFLTIRVDEADLDGDGQDELVGASYFGNQNRYLIYKREGSSWENTGYLSIQAHNDTPVYGMGNSTVDPVDWDGDGDTDLLLGAEGSFPTVVINIGTEQNRVFDPARRLQYTDGTLLETFSIEQGDGSYWGPMEWYSDRIAPRAADWDGDGVLDILTGSMGRRLYFFRGEKVNGELRFHKPANFRYGGDELVLPDRLFPAVLDWTGDGKPDVMVSDDPGHVLVYEGDGSLSLKNPDTLMLSTGQPIVLQDYWERKKGNRSGFTVADWDGDGKRDLVIYMFHRGVFLFRNTGNDTFEEAQPLVPLYSHLAGPSVMDWNQDGVLDLIIGGDERRMIEPDKPAHLAVFYGEHTLSPPKNLKQVTKQ